VFTQVREFSHQGVCAIR